MDRNDDAGTSDGSLDCSPPEPFCFFLFFAFFLLVLLALVSAFCFFTRGPLGGSSFVAFVDDADADADETFVRSWLELSVAVLALALVACSDSSSCGR